LKDLLSVGLYIGVSGCSLKTKENLQVIREIPLDKLLIESAAPHCDIRMAYASYDMIKTIFPIKKFT
jgi:TatD DNase family protein